jgi:hypothetical protein
VNPRVEGAGVVRNLRRVVQAARSFWRVGRRGRVARRVPAVRVRQLPLGWLSACAVATFAVGCRPTLDDRSWLVTQPRILAWQADPPEAAPGSAATIRVIALDPRGPVDTTATSWTVCRAAKPLDEIRVVAPACLSATAPDALGDPVSIVIPADACRLFGPDTPQPAAGAPPTRARDPDATGGYYQPVTMSLGPSIAVGLERIGCGIPDASLAAARAYQAAYLPNRNPTLATLSLTSDGAPVDLGAVPAGARVRLEATWTPDSAETFAVFDPASGTVGQIEEALRVSWYVTGGELDRAADAITGAAAVSTTSIWTTPSGPATLQVLVVLTDSRGGTDAIAATLTTR